MEQISSWLNDHREIVIPLFFLGALVAHFYGLLPAGREFLALFVLMAVIAMFGFIAMVFEPVVTLGDVFLFMTIYGITLYIVLCEMLLRGVAQWLTS